MQTLKKQVDDYLEEAKAEMKAAGFKTTPWDKPAARAEGRRRGWIHRAVVPDQIGQCPLHEGSLALHRGARQGALMAVPHVTIFVRCAAGHRRSGEPNDQRGESDRHRRR